MVNQPNHAGKHAAVVGGGIAGLAAAHRLVEDGWRVTLLEAGPHLGGKLTLGQIAGMTVDVGAESIVSVQPDAVELARAVGLADRLQAPATTAASLWSRGALHPIPRGQVMGVPGDLDTLAESGVLTEDELRRARTEPEIPWSVIDADLGIGDLVARRFGPAVAERLTEPLIGGLHAGAADQVSLRSVLPQLIDAANAEGSVARGVQRLTRRPSQAGQQPAGAAPVPAPPSPFTGIAGGLGLLPQAIGNALTAVGAEVALRAPVQQLVRGAQGWQVRVSGRLVAADAVVLAVPAWQAAQLLGPHAPGAARDLDTIAYGSTALVTFAFPRTDIERLPSGSGFLAPPVDRGTVKAATYLSTKWQWLADADPDLFVLRCAIGRPDSDDALYLDDAELIDAALSELADAAGITAKPVAGTVTRWLGGLPQYQIGHLDLVARVREETGRLPGLTLCGAAYDGIGITACVASGRRAAGALTAAATEAATETVPSAVLTEGKR